MIGIRATLLGTLAVVLPGAAVGSGGPDPSAELGAARLVAERALVADAELGALEEALVQTLDDARRGAVRIVSGDEPPGPHLRLAADRARDGEPAARRSAAALVELAAARRAREPSAGSPEPPLGGGELASIAGQLAATGEAGDEFARMRGRAAEVTVRLDDALAALDRGDVAGAASEVEAARAAFATVEAWEAGPATLPVWIETIDAMIGAVETLVDAVAAGDAGRAERAADAFAAASEDAVVADRALRIAISEGGSAVAATALGRLAGALDAVRSARAEVAAILQAAGR